MTDPRIEAVAQALYEHTIGLNWPDDADRETQSDYREDARIALAAADAAAWRPIESAPKDGTVINVLLPEDISESDRQFYCYPPSRVSFGWAWKNEKFRPSGGLSIPVFIRPTHWMPLPAPPKEAAHD